MLTNSRLGFFNQVFEVQSWALNFGADEVSVDCQLVETNSAVYTWNAEEEDFEQDNTTLPNPFDLTAPSFTATDEVRALNETAISVLMWMCSPHRSMRRILKYRPKKRQTANIRRWASVR